jgi:disulfide bond formation protein DsbB
MTPPITPYNSVVSPRSRRLRTVVSIVLVVIMFMSVYGGFTVMPQVRQAVGRPDTLELTRLAKSQPGPTLTLKQIAHAKRTLRARQVVVSLAMAYWGILSLLLLLVLFLAWLDFRETTRNFALQAQALRQETVVTLQQDSERKRLEGEEEDG